MNFAKELTEALDYGDRISGITQTEEYKQAIKAIKEYRLEIPSVINELTAQDIVARLLAMYKKYQQPLAQGDISRIVSQSLRDEGYANGDEREIMAKTSELMRDPGVMPSITMMLQRAGVKLAMPKDTGVASV